MPLQLAERDALLAQHDDARKAVQKDFAALSVSAKGRCCLSACPAVVNRLALQPQFAALHPPISAYCIQVLVQHSYAVVYGLVMAAALPVPAGAANASEAQFDDLKKQLNEHRGMLEDMRTKYSRAQAEVEAREKEVRRAPNGIQAAVDSPRQAARLQ